MVKKEALKGDTLIQDALYVININVVLFKLKLIFYFILQFDKEQNITMTALNPVPSYNSHRLLRMKDAEKVSIVQTNMYFLLLIQFLFLLFQNNRFMILMKMMIAVCLNLNGSDEGG